MTRDEIISMAWEVGFIEKWQECKGGIEIVKVIDIDKLERFAVLVAVAEREACSQVADKWIGCDLLAAAIRARGEK